MNRKTFRDIQHLPREQFDRVITSVVEEEVEKQKAYTFYNLATSMFTALRRRFPDIMTGEMINSIAIDTVDISNGLETPSELAAALKAETGFDVYAKPHEADFRYIEIGEGS